MATQPEPVF